MLRLALIASCLALTSCGGFEATVKRTAARDFACEEDRIEVSQNDETRLWQASGCEKKAEYRCLGCAFGGTLCERPASPQATSASP